MRVAEIAQVVGGTVVGDGDRAITALAKIDEAGPTELGFIASPKYGRYHETTTAGALLVTPDLARTREDVAYIVVENPQAAFRSLLITFAPPVDLPPRGIHPTAVVGNGADVDVSARIGAHVVLGDRVVVGAGVAVASGTVIGRDTRIGDGTIIHANVTIYDGTVIGRRCVVHSGAVIGADGFGFEPTESGSWFKVPQIGIVVLGDDVEVGANSTIDRATVGRTDIGNGVKIDNLVHVAHNVVIGENSLIAAQAGIAGSSRLGARNLVAGQVGIVGHLDIADDVIMEAQSGVSKSIRKPGRYFGHPAKEHSVALRQEGALRQLPDLLAEIRDIVRRLEKLESVE